MIIYITNGSYDFPESSGMKSMQKGCQLHIICFILVGAGPKLGQPGLEGSTFASHYLPCLKGEHGSSARHWSLWAAG